MEPWPKHLDTTSACPTFNKDRWTLINMRYCPYMATRQFWFLKSKRLSKYFSTESRKLRRYSTLPDAILLESNQRYTTQLDAIRRYPTLRYATLLPTTQR
jgi:hypothetical protein